MILCRSGLKSISRQKGFTLIETLVAVMILAISLVVVMQLFSGGLKSNKRSNDYLYGIFHAREKMEELLLTNDLLPGSFSGDFGDGYQWQAVIDFVGGLDGELNGEEDDMSAKMPVSTMIIQLDVIWKTGSREKRYHLSTTALTDRRETEEISE
jgi:general secretion pathway protein I